jgi:23S rRNA pseudouridine1911/1915/1917 synthase
VARLRFAVEARGPSAARLRVRLETGVTHQIRVQLSLVGMPLVGDAKYGGIPAPARARCDRPALHALRLVVPHPTTRAPLSIEAPVPADLVRLGRSLGL